MRGGYATTSLCDLESVDVLLPHQRHVRIDSGTSGSAIVGERGAGLRSLRVHRSPAPRLSVGLPGRQAATPGPSDGPCSQLGTLAEPRSEQSDWRCFSAVATHRVEQPHTQPGSASSPAAVGKRGRPNLWTGRVGRPVRRCRPAPAEGRLWRCLFSARCLVQRFGRVGQIAAVDA